MRKHNDRFATITDAMFPQVFKCSSNRLLLCIFLVVVAANSATGAADIDSTLPQSIPVEIITEWKTQGGTDYDSSIARIKSSIPKKYADRIEGSGEQGYLIACHWRRVSRMQPYSKELKKIVYARHHDLGGPTIGHIEEMEPDGYSGIGKWGVPGNSKSADYPAGGASHSALLLLELTDYYPLPQTIMDDNRGILRDPCPTLDGTALVYAHSPDNNGYHLWNYDFSTRGKRQITDNPSGLVVSDFEPCVLPTGDIIFNSSRCFGHVDVGTNITSNLYLCNKDGRYLRRVGYDQVHTFYPTLVEDGTVMYSRWEYNDRDIATVCGIFTLNQDGGRQQEYFGNQTEWPAYFIQARAIPGNPMKVLSVISGYLGPYAGDLAIVDARRTRNGENGVTLIAPKRPVKHPDNIREGVPDADKLFQNPYPLDEEWFLISYRTSRGARFRIYLMNVNGDRELLAWDSVMSVSQPVSLMPHPPVVITSSLLDLTRTTSEASISDVQYGTAMEGIARGTVKKVRVVGLEYRTDPSFGYTGTATTQQMTPIGRYGCAWMAKWIIGEIDVESDGSAAFTVPSNTPFFLQCIAADGTCVQTMRSWMTLMPGERFDCFGCHEDKNAAPPTANPLATNAKPLKPFFDLGQQPGTFHYPDVIQPILDKNCVKSGCHDASHPTLDLSSKPLWTNDLVDSLNNNAFRYWNTSYYNLSSPKRVSYEAIAGSAAGISPRSLGSSRSALIDTLRNGHQGMTLSESEFGKLCAWIDLGVPHSGTYTDDMKLEHREMYLERLERRHKMRRIEEENLAEFIAAGGYTMPPYNSGRHSIRPRFASAKPEFRTQRLTCKLSGRSLTILPPSEGVITLTTVAGRTLLSRSTVGTAGISIACQFAPGIYIVKFTGPQAEARQTMALY